jgi:hypothetical protein
MSFSLAAISSSVSAVEDVRAQHDGGVKTPRDERSGDAVGRIIYLTRLRLEK